MSSPRSFYSMSSQHAEPKTADRKLPPATAVGIQPPTPSQDTTMTNLEDVETWLSHPENIAMLQNIADKAPSKPKKRLASAHDEPPLTGVENPSQVVAAFHALCQKKGIEPDFDIREQEPSRFSGTLVLGEDVVALEVGMRSKKDAKAWLAHQGLPILESMEGQTKSSASAGTNWVGKLTEFTYSLAIRPSLDFAISSPAEQKFTCTLTISPSPLLPLSASDWILSTPNPFSSKKAAKSACAEQAVTTLIASGKLSPEGNIIKRKPPPQTKSQVHTRTSQPSNPGSVSVAAPVDPLGTSHSPQPPSSSSSAHASSEISNAARAAALAVELGLSPPTYKLAAADPENAPVMLSGAAWISGATLVVDGVQLKEGGPLGEVRNVYGKKRAKEECARGVVAALEEVKRQRLKGVRDRAEMTRPIGLKGEAQM